MIEITYLSVCKVNSEKKPQPTKPPPRKIKKRQIVSYWECLLCNVNLQKILSEKMGKKRVWEFIFNSWHLTEISEYPGKEFHFSEVIIQFLHL